MTIAEPPVLVFSLVAKHHTDACPRPDLYSAKIRGNRNFEALRLGFYDSREIKNCMALYVEIHILAVITKPSAMSCQVRRAREMLGAFSVLHTDDANESQAKKEVRDEAQAGSGARHSACYRGGHQ